jgi:CRP/FNR family transcriptional regulator, cyclic AMP receptor protein
MTLELGGIDVNTSIRDNTLALARCCPAFAGLDNRALAEVVGSCDEEIFAAGNRIVTTGLQGQETFLILEGVAWVVVDDDAVITLGPGEVFGEMAVLDGGARTASVVARTQLRCLVLPNRGLRDLVLGHPRVGLNLLEMLSRRLRAVEQRLRQPALPLTSYPGQS